MCPLNATFRRCRCISERSPRVSSPVSGCCNVDGDCDDSNPCTTDACDVGAHTCSHGAVDCDDGALCTTDFCDPGAGCQHANVPNCCLNDSDCDDHDICDGRERCTSNRCTGGTAANCDDQNPCTDDHCDPQVGCLHVNNASACDDGDACTRNVRGSSRREHR